MKANELRIGNKVDCFGIKEVDSIIRTANGSFKLIVCEKKESGVSICESVLIESVDLKPIPLTEEWLLKFGFDDNGIFVDDSRGFLYWDGSSLHISDSRDTNYTFVAICEHVHQLQNLYFALTNEELKIEL